MRGGARVLGRGGPGILRREIGREPLVERLDGNVDRRAQRLYEPLRLLRLLAAAAGQRERQADDDPPRALLLDQLAKAREPRPGRRALDHAERPRQRPRGIRDRDARARATVVEREHLHAGTTYGTG